MVSDMGGMGNVDEEWQIWIELQNGWGWGWQIWKGLGIWNCGLKTSSRLFFVCKELSTSSTGK